MKSLNKLFLIGIIAMLCLGGCSNKKEITETKAEVTENKIDKNLDEIVLTTLKHKYPLTELEIKEKDKELNTYVIYDAYNKVDFNVETIVLSNQKVEFRDDYMVYNIDCKMEQAKSFIDNNINDIDYTIELSKSDLYYYIDINYGDICIDEEIYYLAKDIENMMGLWLTYNLNPNYSVCVIDSYGIETISIDKVELYYRINCNNYYNNNTGESTTIKFNYASSEFGLADTEELSDLIKEQLIFNSNKDIILNCIFTEEEILNNNNEVYKIAEEVLNKIYEKHGVITITEMWYFDSPSDTRKTYAVKTSTAKFNAIIDRDAMQLNEIIVN